MSVVAPGISTPCVTLKGDAKNRLAGKPKKKHDPERNVTFPRISLPNRRLTRRKSWVEGGIKSWNNERWVSVVTPTCKSQCEASVSGLHHREMNIKLLSILTFHHGRHGRIQCGIIKSRCRARFLCRLFGGRLLRWLVRWDRSFDNGHWNIPSASQSSVGCWVDGYHIRCHDRRNEDELKADRDVHDFLWAEIDNNQVLLFRFVRDCRMLDHLHLWSANHSLVN